MFEGEELHSPCEGQIMRMEWIVGSSRWKAKLCIGHVVFGSNKRRREMKSLFEKSFVMLSMQRSKRELLVFFNLND